MNASRDVEHADDDWDDENSAYDEDSEQSDGEPTIPCPYCRRDILEDTPRCPYCERYISAEDHDAPQRPVWVSVTALVCLGIAIYWVVYAF